LITLDLASKLPPSCGGKLVVPRAAVLVRPLPLADVFESKFDYDSKPLTPLEPVFPEIRESKFQVKVRVRYRWATGPFSSLPEIE
jgi:hypothetical protein